MELDPKDKNRLSEFYGEALERHGPYSPRALRWISGQNQTTRFNVLCRVGEISGSSVLDVGSGLGDLFPFLSERFSNIDYLGIDILPQMVQQARFKYPTGKFWSQGVTDIEAQFDYVLASGALTFTIGSGREFYYQMIAQMFQLAKKALAFNMLDASMQASDGQFLAYDRREVAEVCQKLTPNYRISADYELGDFTVFLFK